jgi:hypothetical protein
MTLRDDEMRYFRLSHLDNKARCAFGENGPEIEIDVSDARPDRRVNWNTVAERAVAGENARRSRESLPAIDGRHVGGDRGGR